MIIGISRGKQFEEKFKLDFNKVPNSHVERIYDVTNGFRSIRSRSDYICYIYPNLYFIECKSHYGNTFPFSEFRQYNDMLEVSGKKGIRSGIVLWMIDHSKVIYLPVITIKRMKENGKKSFNIKDLNNQDYKTLIIPSKKKRVFLDSDYSILTCLEEGD